MVTSGIMAGMCTSPHPSPYPIEKVGDFLYPYSYPVNVRISCSDNTHKNEFICHL